jgi:hypothetical protein
VDAALSAALRTAESSILRYRRYGCETTAFARAEIC